MLVWTICLLCLTVAYLGDVAVSACPDATWKSHSQGSCLKVFTEPMKSWHSARNHCQTLGGDLIEIRDQQMNDVVTETIGALPANERYFIGVSDQNLDGVYTYQNEEPLTYQNWRQGEPRKGWKNEPNCAEIIANKNGRWKQKPCIRLRKYICDVKEGSAITDETEQPLINAHGDMGHEDSFDEQPAIGELDDEENHDYSAEQPPIGELDDEENHDYSAEQPPIGELDDEENYDYSAEQPPIAELDDEENHDYSAEQPEYGEPDDEENHDYSAAQPEYGEPDDEEYPDYYDEMP